ncbi:MAG TPA: prolipoprotein diacylglyceryl transferase [Miltoncostaeaceae bacterium]|nr:prolipoprotein diacylglyceryl transferase [Miltoncostaeaceae bacterium]
MSMLAGGLQALAASIPAPPGRAIELGPLTIRAYALCVIAGIAVGTWLTLRRWRARGGDPDLVFEVALWITVAGLIGARLYHVVTSPDQIGDEWYAPFAVWEGGLGIWGGVLFGTLAGAFVVRRAGASVTQFMDAAAPAIPLGHAVGRLGNWFNQELFGGPTDLPWALEVDPRRRPAGYEDEATFHPTFLYEGLWNVGVAVALIVIGRRLAIRPPGLFCLYVALYTLGRAFWELLRIDPSSEFLGQRVNFWVSVVLCVGALVAFVLVQRRGRAPASV